MEKCAQIFRLFPAILCDYLNLAKLGLPITNMTDMINKFQIINCAFVVNLCVAMETRPFFSLTHVMQEEMQFYPRTAV